MGPSTPSRKQIIAFILIMGILQISGFIFLGTSPVGTLFTDGLSIIANILAIICSLTASRRGRGASRIFWFLFGSAFALLLIANVGWAICRYFNITIAEGAVFPSLFYRLYAVPMAITLFLSDDIRTSKLETFLDSCIVVGVVGWVFYQVQCVNLIS